jgi:peroxiredoxin
VVALILSFVTQQTSVSLSDIHAKIAKLPGVIVKCEMIAPSVVPMQFVIAPGGWLAASYPTTIQYTHGDKITTWMPDRREYSIAKTDYPNPLPAGFDSLWPGAGGIEQTGPPVRTIFEKKDCFSYPCKGFGGQELQLMVDSATMMPYGTRATANGTTYEMVYRSIEIRKVLRKEVEFVPPPDAKVAKPGPPVVNLIKTGTKLGSFSAVDQQGRKHTLTSLLKAKKGLIFNFWFSSCTGCVAEMPYLVKLHPQLVKSGIGLIGVNAIDEPSIATRTSQRNQLPYPTLVGGTSKVITKQTGVLGYPVTMIIDRNRTVVDAFMGFDEDRLTKAVEKLKSR